MDCQHTRATKGDDYGFSAPVAVHPYTDENPAAHGCITYTETCVACGAHRSVNQNQRHVEVSPWGPTRSQREAACSRWQMETATRIQMVGDEVGVEVGDVSLDPKLHLHEIAWSITVGIRGDYRRYTHRGVHARVNDPNNTAGAREWWSRLRDVVDSCVRSAPVEG